MGDRVVTWVLNKASWAFTVSHERISTLFVAESTHCLTRGHPGSVVSINSSTERILFWAKFVKAQWIRIKTEKNRIILN